MQKKRCGKYGRIRVEETMTAGQGIAYILGLFTIISAILCFISCKDNRKLSDVEEKAVSNVVV